MKRSPVRRKRRSFLYYTDHNWNSCVKLGANRSPLPFREGARGWVGAIAGHCALIRRLHQFVRTTLTLTLSLKGEGNARARLKWNPY